MSCRNRPVDWISQCTNCSACNGTVRSRRCSCSKVPYGYGDANYRNTAECNNNGMLEGFGGYSQAIRHIDPTSRDYLLSPYLDSTEAYGSGLRQQDLQEMRIFNNNVAISTYDMDRARSLKTMARTPFDGCCGQPTMNLLQAQNAIRYGRDLTLQ